LIKNRRDFMGIVAAGSVAVTTGLFPATSAAKGKRGLVDGKGILYINGKPAIIGDEVKPGDRVETGEGGSATIALGDDAFLLREKSDVIFPSESATEKVLKVISGGLLSVFGPKKLVIDTPMATIGIRGTGAYVRILEDRVYACLCYGEAELTSKINPTMAETLKTFHHDAPRFIRGSGPGNLIEKAPVEDHSDSELIMLEELVNRTPPFGDQPLGDY